MRTWRTGKCDSGVFEHILREGGEAVLDRFTSLG